jgi:hypothetical protein
MKTPLLKISWLQEYRSLKSAWALMGLLVMTCCWPVRGQYTIDWFTLDGGGGTSSGGIYSVTGTVGQPDAGLMNGGNFSLTGGFWGAVLAVAPVLPELTIALTAPHAVMVSWPVYAVGWKLECTAALLSGTSTWVVIMPPYMANATHFTVTELLTAGNKFYRLRKP